MTAQQLKNSILLMAVQGKLVPQDPNDEPASVLLERIHAEKERLIKEKKIKREKNPSVIFKGADNTPMRKSAMKCGRWRMRYRLTSPIRGSGCGSLMSVSTSSVESHRSILQSKSTPLSPKSAINGAVFRLKRHSLLSRILCPPMGLSVFCRTTT